MSDSPVRHNVSDDGAVHTLTIDRPPGNIIDTEICELLRPVIRTAGEAENGKVLVLRGAGKHFSYGASVVEHLPDKAPQMLAALGTVIGDLVGFPYPTIAGVQGSCLGGGFELALACGIVIAEEHAKFASPEIQLGVIAPAATALLHGRGAEDILLTGRSFTAEEAQRMGIVNLIAPAGDLDAFIDDFVEKHFVPRSALSLRLATKAVRGKRLAVLQGGLADAERLYLEELLPTHDGVEGIKAFVEKRPPQWTNG